MFARFFSLPTATHSVFIFGPRGTGKTTWLKEHLSAEVYIDLLDGDAYLRLSAHPSSLSQYIRPGYTGPVIIDEIQRIPQLLNEVYRLIEADDIRFVMTGSSTRSLRKRGVNLLAGRALTSYMFPLTAMELGSAFVLEDSIRFGHLPMVYSFDTQEEKLSYMSSYVQTYINQEVQSEGYTRNIGAFTRFLEIASFSHGSIINYSAIGKDAGINRKVVENYFSILEDMLLGMMLPVFRKRAKRDMRTAPKFYFFDTGIYQSLRPKGPFDSYSEISGPAVEGLFIQDVRAYNDYQRLGYELYYWRTRSNIEVNLVLYGQRGIKAFEIKHAKTVRPKDLRGLKAFGEDYPEAQLFIIYLGSTKQYHGNITALPLDWALRHLDEIL
jgi:predicted AAA+ superfamily ATPase